MTYKFVNFKNEDKAILFISVTVLGNYTKQGQQYMGKPSISSSQGLIQKT